MITLRILAGASYLDIIHYHIHIDSGSKILWKTLSAIHENLNNIVLPSTNEEFLAIVLRLLFNWLQKTKFGPNGLLYTWYRVYDNLWKKTFLWLSTSIDTHFVPKLSDH